MYCKIQVIQNNEKFKYNLIFKFFKGVWYFKSLNLIKIFTYKTYTLIKRFKYMLPNQ